LAGGKSLDKSLPAAFGDDSARIIWGEALGVAPTKRGIVTTVPTQNLSARTFVERDIKIAHLPNQFTNVISFSISKIIGR
jgi:hypothetical protein